MARKRRRADWHAGELNLTAMIDLAFQLLSFFIITAHPSDVISQLNVFRPSPEQVRKDSDLPDQMIKIQLLVDGAAINDRPVNTKALGSLLQTLAKDDKKQTVLIICEGESQHGRLIEVLDLCAKVGLTNLSVLSAAVGGH